MVNPFYRKSGNSVSPQGIILKAILDLGGKATTREIHLKCGLTAIQVHRCGRHLVSRQLVKKVTTKSGPYGSFSEWTVNRSPNTLAYIKKLMQRDFGEQYDV